MKKFLTVLLSTIGALMAAVLILIGVCYFNPGMSNKISSLLYKEDASGGTDDSSSEEGVAEDIFAVIDPSLDADNVEKSYEPVRVEEIKVSDELRKLTGYSPIREDGEEIGDKEAEEIRDELGYGNLGDEYSFDKLYYPYYHMLGDDLKSIYRQIYANANDLNDKFATVKTVLPKELKYAFMAVVNDHPELFFLNTEYAYKYTKDGTAEMNLSFNETAGNIDAARESFEAAASDLIYDVSGDDMEKEKTVHDRLVDKITYDLDSPMNQSAYSAMVSGNTVCAGYARAFQYLMQKLSIPCYYCTGYAGESHAWNIIGLDDGYYNVDVTWDDTNPATYDYFNLADADIRRDHMRKDLSIYLPACKGETHRMPYANRREEEPQEEAQGLRENDYKPKRSLNETGFSEEDITRDLNSYFEKCYDALSNGKGGDMSFDLVIKDSSLLDTIMSTYNSEGYKGAFMNRFMEENDVPFCSFNVGIEELQDGYYLLNHVFVHGELEQLEQ